MFLQLAPYAGRARPGISFDTPYYVWRTRLVAAEGSGPLTTLPEAVTPNPDRPGFPVLGAVVGAITGMDAFTFAIAIRAVAAVAIGLAAGAMAVAALGHPPWSFGIYVFALGASAAVTGTAIGSLENLVVDVPLMALAGAIPLALRGRRALGAIALLFAGAALIHWVFACLFLLLTVVVAASSLVPTADRRAGPGARVGGVRVVLLVGTALVAVAFAALLLPALPDGLPPTSGEKGNLLRLGIYELPYLLPLAALGAVLSYRRATATARTTVMMLAIWAASVPAAIVISWALPVPLKIFRVAAFALGVPALAAAALVSLVRLGRDRLGAAGASLAIGSMTVALAIGMASDAGPFNDRAAAHIAERLEQARTAGRYLATTDEGRSIVFVVDGRVGTIDRVVRSAVPPDRITDTHVYVGEPDDLLRGRPLSDPTRPKLSADSAAWWRAAWPHPEAVLRRDPIVIGLGLAPETAVSGIPLDAHVRVFRGPDPPAGFSPAPPIRLGWSRAILLVVAALALLLAVGFGWVRSFLDVGTVAALGFAPALGAAVLVILGGAAARLGPPVGGLTGVVVVVLGVAAGWLPFVLGRRSSAARTSEGES